MRERLRATHRRTSSQFDRYMRLNCELAALASASLPHLSSLQFVSHANANNHHYTARGMRLSLPAALITALLTLSLAACGGGSDTLSKAELTKKANAICKDFDKRIAAVPQPTGARNPGTAAAYYAQTRPIVSQSIVSLKKLKPGDSVKKDWKIYLDKQDEAARLLDDLVKQINERDPNAQRTLAQINAAAATGTAAIRRVGASSCASTAAAPA
jgi:hypothetical protein